MKEYFFGDTKGRYAYIGKQKGKSTYYLAYTDWSIRQGGSMGELTLDNAINIAKEFINGCEFRFDPDTGMILV